MWVMWLCQPLCNLVPEYHRWKQDELCHILQAIQKHCGLQNLQTAQNQLKQSEILRLDELTNLKNYTRNLQPE